MTAAPQILALVILVGPTVTRYADRHLFGYDDRLAFRRVARDLTLLACLIWGGFFGVAP